MRFRRYTIEQQTHSLHVHHLRLTNRNTKVSFWWLCVRNGKERKVPLFNLCLYFGAPKACARDNYEIEFLRSTASREKTLFLWLIYNIIMLFMRTTWVISSIWKWKCGECDPNIFSIQEIADYIKIRKRNYCVRGGGGMNEWGGGWKEAAEKKIAVFLSKMALIVDVAFSRCVFRFCVQSIYR